MTTFSRVAIILMLAIFMAFMLLTFGIYVLTSPIDEGQEWSSLATAGILRGAV